MPYDLVLVRHGESEGNVAVGLAKNGDSSAYTDEFATTPGRRWRLTAKGRAQAACAGEWLMGQFPNHAGPQFSRHYASPYVRTKETAALLGLHWFHAGDVIPGPQQPQWYLNRGLRERDWGDIGSIPRQEFLSRPEFALNVVQRKIDPLYWVPPGGESIAHVAENRVRNFLDTLHREADGGRVIAVTHGEFMWSTRLVLERLDDEQYMLLDDDRAEHIHNCEVRHYTRTDPTSDGDRLSSRLEWVRRAYPIQQPTGEWTMQVGPWKRVEFNTYTNDGLLDSLTAPVSGDLCL